jgi:hypothetical protein
MKKRALGQLWFGVLVVLGIVVVVFVGGFLGGGDVRLTPDDPFSWLRNMQRPVSPSLPYLLPIEPEITCTDCPPGASPLNCVQFAFWDSLSSGGSALGITVFGHVAVGAAGPIGAANPLYGFYDSGWKKEDFLYGEPDELYRCCCLTNQQLTDFNVKLAKIKSCEGNPSITSNPVDNDEEFDWFPSGGYTCATAADSTIDGLQSCLGLPLDPAFPTTMRNAMARSAGCKSEPLVFVWSSDYPQPPGPDEGIENP